MTEIAATYRYDGNSGRGQKAKEQPFVCPFFRFEGHGIIYRELFRMRGRNIVRIHGNDVWITPGNASTIYPWTEKEGSVVGKVGINA